MKRENGITNAFESIDNNEQEIKDITIVMHDNPKATNSEIP